MKIGKDKAYHAGAGLIIFLVFWWWFSVEVALTVTVLSAFFKELYDTFIKKKHFEYWDFVATIIIPIIIYGVATT